MRADGRPSLSRGEMRWTVRLRKGRRDADEPCVAYFVAVAMHIALASPISGHFVASSNQFPNCLIGSKEVSWLSSKHWWDEKHKGKAKHNWSILTDYEPNTKCNMIYGLFSFLVELVRSGLKFDSRCQSNVCSSSLLVNIAAIAHRVNSGQVWPRRFTDRASGG